MPFLQATGLKSDYPEVQLNNVAFFQSISSQKVVLFQPPKNESRIRKYTLDNILFHRDDRIHFVANTQKNSYVATIKPAAEYSFPQQQNYHRHSITSQGESLAAFPNLARNAVSPGLKPQSPNFVIRPQAVYKQSGYQYGVPNPPFYN